MRPRRLIERDDAMLSILIFCCFVVLALFGMPIAHALIVASEIGLIPSDRLGVDFIV